MSQELITDLDEIRRLADERRDEFEVLRYTLEGDDDLTDAEIDAAVDSIAQPIIAAIDCTKCANCCQGLLVSLVPEDAVRLADGIDIPVDQVVTQYVDLERGREVEEWGVFRHRPCVFLRDKLCSIYPHRPASCRTYPLFTPDFRWTLEHTIAGAGTCPIIYNVLSAMVMRADELIAEAGRRARGKL
jgi:Fe-S-cluster containining protein